MKKEIEFWMQQVEQLDLATGRTVVIDLGDSPIKKGMVFICRSCGDDIYYDPADNIIITSSFNIYSMNVEYSDWDVDDVLDGEYPGMFTIGALRAIQIAVQKGGDIYEQSYVS